MSDVHLTEKQFLEQLSKKIHSTHIWKKIVLSIVIVISSLFPVNIYIVKLLSLRAKISAISLSIIQISILVFLCWILILYKILFFYRAFVTSNSIIDVYKNKEQNFSWVLIIYSFFYFFFVSLILPTTLLQMLIAVVSPFIFPIFETIRRLIFHNKEKLTIKQLFLRIQLITGYQIGFVLFMIVIGTFLNLIFLLIINAVFHCYENKSLQNIFYLIGAILAIPIILFTSFRIRLPILKIFLKNNIGILNFLLGVFLVYSEIIFYFYKMISSK